MPEGQLFSKDGDLSLGPLLCKGSAFTNFENLYGPKQQKGLVVRSPKRMWLIQPSYPHPVHAESPETLGGGSIGSQLAYFCIFIDTCAVRLI